MRHPLFRALMAWLCMFAFGLNMAVHALGSVVCISDDGICFEWSCEKDGRGMFLATTHVGGTAGGPACDARSGGQDRPSPDPERCSLDPTRPAPCRDLPVDDDHAQAHHLLVQTKQNGHAAFAFQPLTIAAVPPRVAPLPVRLARAGPGAVARPPDVLGRLAAIVMIV